MLNTATAVSIQPCATNDKREKAADTAAGREVMLRVRVATDESETLRTNWAGVLARRFE